MRLRFRPLPSARLGLVFAVALLVGVALAFVTPVWATSDALSDVQRLRAEVHALKGQLLEARYQLATCQAQQQAASLATERQALEAEFRDVLAPPAGAVFDWQTLTFTPPPSPPDPRPKP